MTKTYTKIVFFGSGPVAARSLELLAQSFEIEAVITKPRPPHHKGSVPVLEVAKNLVLPLLEARNKKELSVLLSTKSFLSEVAVLIDFGIIVEQQVIDTFPLGIVNSHFSLLPQLRGADPITFSILSGQQKTGVSLMLLVEAMDEGPLLAQGEQVIEPATTAPSLTDDLIELSYALLRDVLPLYITGKITAQPQDITAGLLGINSLPTYSRKLSKADSVLDWNKPAVLLEREIRAFVEWPKSRTTLGKIDVVITRAHVTESTGGAGSIHAAKNELLVNTADQALAIDELVPAGKKAMSIAAFLSGYRSQL